MSERIEYLAKSNAAYYVLYTLYQASNEKDWMALKDLEKTCGIDIPSMVLDEILTRFEDWGFVKSKSAPGRHGYVITEKGSKTFELYKQLLNVVKTKI